MSPNGDGGSDPHVTGRIVVRWYHVLPALIVIVAAAVLGGKAIRNWRVDRASRARAAPASLDLPVEAPLDPSSAEALAMPRRRVTTYWPAADGTGLVARDAEVFATASTSNQAKQVVGLLLAGPPDGDEELVRPLPEGTALRAVFIDRYGTAYVSLSGEARASAVGGSDWEMLAVHALVNSLVASFREIERVQLLIEGNEVETLAGHLDARYPFRFNDELVTATPSP